ncbi:MAG TPA: YceI family protein [Gemmatimonadales bacterium]|jgi:polyisoprenoid-binding protein YceI|nr:YceI family protein [Gemmatimonadales bacterium]
MIRIVRLAAMLSLLAAAPLALHAQAPAAPAALPTWSIDVAHSEITFRIRHFMSRVSGTFTDWSGSIQADPAHWAGGAVSATINVASVDTRQERRDADLRSARFFNADSFPTITFVSRSVAQQGDSLTITGDLTMRGVTKSVVLKGAVLGVMPGERPRAGFEVSTTLNRLDYGVAWNRILEGGGSMLGDDVEIRINVEALRQP